MRIGIDAKWYFNGPVSGRLVIKNLVDQIIKQDDKHEWFIFLDKQSAKIDFQPERNNVKLVYIWNPNTLLCNMLILPFYAFKNRIDVVFFQNFSTFLFSFKKIIFVYDILFKRNPEYFSLLERIYFFPIKYMSRLSDGVITISDSVKNDLVDFKFVRETRQLVEVIYLGMSSSYKPLKLQNQDTIRIIKLKYDLPDAFLLFVGRINIRKNIQNLLRAILYMKNKDIKLVIVGRKDWALPQIDALINHDRLKERIIFLDAVTDQELPYIYSLSKVFCFPSFAEGFGLPPLEAMASGIPVVVSNTTSLPEVCGNAGNYVDPLDYMGMAEVIDNLLVNDELYLRKVSEGLERATFFSWEKSGKDFINVVNKLN
jgi:glycosyltransferase involved in cell wall biosynthesis